MKGFLTMLVVAMLASVSSGCGATAAGNSQKLSGSNIRAKFVGMELTDEVHYRFVYDRNGALRSYSMGVNKIGKWTIENDQLCLYLDEPDDGCYEVSRVGERIELNPVGLGSPIDGILQMPAD